MIKKKNFGALIFARMSSTRMPKKVLKKINNKTILWYVYNRVKQICPNNKIIIVTSTSVTDIPIIDFCLKNKISFYRGSLKNVLKRSVDCCKKYKLDYFMRICADRPFLDYKIGKKMYRSDYENYDLTTNNLIKSYPKGQTFEIIKLTALNSVLKKKLSKNFKEHICDYFYKNSENFKIKNFRSQYSKKVIDLNLSLDTEFDFKRIQMCYKYFDYNPIIATSKVIKYFSKFK